MRARPAYNVPIRWFEGQSLVDSRSCPGMPANTYVLVIPRDVTCNFTVERINGSKSKHIPEKRPTYRLTWEEGHWRYGLTEDLHPVLLRQVPWNCWIAVERPVTDRVWCSYHGDLDHLIVRINETGTHTLCGLTLERKAGPSVRRHRVAVANCPGCLQNAPQGTFWTVFRVAPHADVKRDRLKAVRARQKAAAKERAMLKRPTAYDVLLYEDPLNPPPKPKPPRPELPEPDPFEAFEQAPREAKLASRRQTALRFRASKRRH